MYSFPMLEQFEKIMLLFRLVWNGWFHALVLLLSKSKLSKLSKSGYSVIVIKFISD